MKFFQTASYLASTFLEAFSLGTRNALNLQYVTQVGAKDAILDPAKNSHGCPVVYTPGM